PVRVGEEDRIVAADVLRVLAGAMQDRAAEALDVAGQRIHLLAALGAERDLAEPDAVLRERLARVLGVGLLDPEASAAAEPPGAQPLVLPARRIAEARHERSIERPAALQVVHRGK